jgi:enoyl-CoA hydratase/carnithine racemase
VDEQLVLRSDADGVATLTLNRPQKVNALTMAVFVALRRHLDALRNASGIGCVVLTGAGRVRGGDGRSSRGSPHANDRQDTRPLLDRDGRWRWRVEII